MPLLTSLRPDLPPELDAFIALGMAKDPAARPVDGAAFIDELDVVIAAALDHRRALARRPRREGDTLARQDHDDPFESTVDGEPDDSRGPDTASMPAVASSYGGSRRERRESGDIDWRLDDGTVDGALVGVFEDEPRRRWPVVVLVLVLVVAVAVVGFLAYRAVQADSDTTAQQVMSPSGSVSFTM